MSRVRNAAPAMASERRSVALLAAVLLSATFGAGTIVVAGTAETAAPASGAPTAAVAQSGLTSRVEAWTTLRLSEGSEQADGFTVSFGHLKLVLSSGTATVVRAGDRPAGLFLKGDGRFEFVSEDPDEFAVMQFNAGQSRLHTATEDGRVRLGDPFRTALLLTEDPLPALASPAKGPAPTKDFEDHRAFFARDWGPPAVGRLAQHDLNAPGAAFVRVEMRGGPEDLVYERDEAIDRREVLSYLRRVQTDDRELKDYLDQNILSEQKVGRPRRAARGPDFLLANVSVDLRETSPKEAAVSVEETIVPKRDGVRALRFGLYDKLYAWLSSGRSEKRLLTVRSVTGEGGAPLEFFHANDTLLVDLGHAPARDKPLTLRFEFGGPILIRPNNDSFWQLGPGAWFPLPSEEGQAYRFTATVRTRKPFRAFAPGVAVARREEGEFNVLESQCNLPISWATLLAGSYETGEDHRDGLTIRVGTYSNLKKPSIDRLIEMSYGIIGWLEPRMGRFPFDDYTILEINSYGYGQSPPGLTFITKEFLGIGETRVPWLYTGGSSQRFANQLAQQWWGNRVRPAGPEDAWIAEGIPMYLSAVLVRASDNSDADYRRILGHWKGSADRSDTVSSIATASRVSIPLDASAASDHRARLLYFKAACLLATIHAEVGDDTFFKFLRAAYTKLQGTAATTEDVRKILESVTGKDYGPFFDRYLWGTEIPTCGLEQEAKGR